MLNTCLMKESLAKGETSWGKMAIAWNTMTKIELSKIDMNMFLCNRIR